MYEELLQKLGLSANEARVYEALLTRGKTKASVLVPDLGLGRGNVYNILTNLVSRGLVAVTEGKQQVYQAVEPSKLSLLLDEQKRKTERLSADFREELPKLLSTFNLTTGKPTMRVFEGLEGFAEALQDSLTTKGEILTYFDASGVTGDIAAVNTKYVQQRIKKGIAKRLLMADTPETRVFFARQATPLTRVAFVPGFPTGYKTAMEIYGDSVSFLTLSPEKIIAVILTDVHIAAMARQQFEFLWNAYAMPPDFAAAP